MRRRDTLRKCAAVGVTAGSGLLVALSDGDGSNAESEAGGETKSGPLAVSNVDYREDDAGNFVAVISVTNSGDAEATGTLAVNVTAAKSTTEDADDTTTVRQSTEVTVSAGETQTVSLSFSVTFAQFERKGSLDAEVRT
ncbi:hypothetical protein [Halorussus lipolyticus]|uniref:hypothetical protein n=1 Tax=Halorussus lipolyticus TaxID=3034024 RepID=UPI0023E83DD8|nr:hypothetical protein [Halorussus sp. DT80]